VDRSFVTYESVGSLECFEVPDHNGAVVGAGDDLFEVWVEKD